MLYATFALSGSAVKAEIIFASETSVFALNGANAQLVLDTPITNFDGTLKITNKSATSITQNSTETITFADGRLAVEGNTGKFTGVLDPASTDTLELTGNHFLKDLTGTVPEAISVDGTGNAITGTPILTGGITLVDAATELTLGITSKLASNIVLGGGTLTLSEDLHIDDNVQITGNGTIDIAGKSLILPIEPSDAIPGDVDFENANDITVRVRTLKSSGTWSFQGAGQSSTIRGWGVILDLTGGGKIRCRSNHTLDINNLHIKGLGATGLGELELEANATVRLTNCVIELDGSYTQTNGTILVDGDGCKVIVNAGEQFIVSGGSTVFTVDGVVLRYDELGALTADPMVTASGGTINKINGGVILTTYVPGISTNITVSGTTGSTDSNIDLTSASTLTFENATPASPKAISYDANGNVIAFDNGPNQTVVVEENVTLTLNDVVMDNFDPAKFDLQGAGPTKAKVEFGDGSVVGINKDLTVATDPITFTGNGTLNANGHKLTLDAADMLTADGNKTVNLRDVKLLVSDFHGLKAKDANATFNLQDMDIYMTETGITYDLGNIDIEDRVRMIGNDPTSPGGASEFKFTTDGSFNIKSISTLELTPGTTFTYDPDVSGDGAVASVEKRHMTFTDPSSTMILESATFDSGPSGIALDYGKVLVDGKTNINISTTAGKEFELGDAVELEILPAAVFSVNGPLVFVDTSFP